MTDRLTPDQLLARLDDPRLAIVDVRTYVEFRSSRIPGARFVGLPKALATPQAIDLEPVDEVVLICLSGHRSRVPLAGLRSAHPDTTFLDLEGGMLAWWAAGHPTG